MSSFKSTTDFSSQRRRKILWNFFLFIAIPCCLLLALAYRGIVNDQALKDRETRLDIQSSLLAAEDSFSIYLRNREDEIPSFISNPNLLSHTTDSVLIGVYQVISNKAVVSSPYLLYGASLSGNQLIDISNEYFPEGWRYEFVDKDYDKAISFYSRQLNLVTDSLGTAQLLMVLGRLYNKSEQLIRASETYEKVIEGYAGYFLSKNVPAELAASLELVKVLTFNRQYEEARQKLIHAKAKVLAGVFSSWSETDYNFFMNSLEEQWETLASKLAVTESSRQRWEELHVIQRSKEELTSYLLDFSNIGGEDLLISGCQTRQINGQTYVFSNTYIPKESTHAGIIYSVSTLARSFTYLVRHFTSQISSFELRDADRTLDEFQTTNQSEPNSLTLVMGQNLPSWSYHVSYGSASLMDSWNSPMQNPFIYIMGIGLIMLALGLVFSVRFVNREISLTKMKSDFVSTVSHEFKSPLTSIRQMLEMIHTDRVTDPARRKEYMEVMLKESERLTHLLENTLDFSRMEAGKKRYDFLALDLHAILNKAIEHFRDFHPNEEIETAFCTEVPIVQADENAIMHIMHNLLDNAVKYADPKRPNRMIISTSISEREVQIRIKDHGIGISEADRKRIFERFYRAGDSLTRKVKGTGIGLNIVHNLIMDHKGQIDVVSEIGDGTEFIVTLPILIPDEQ